MFDELWSSAEQICDRDNDARVALRAICTSIREKRGNEDDIIQMMQNFPLICDMKLLSGERLFSLFAEHRLVTCFNYLTLC